MNKSKIASTLIGACLSYQERIKDCITLLSDISEKKADALCERISASSFPALDIQYGQTLLSPYLKDRDSEALIKRLSESSSLVCFFTHSIETEWCFFCSDVAYCFLSSINNVFGSSLTIEPPNENGIIQIGGGSVHDRVYIAEIFQLFETNDYCNPIILQWKNI